MNVGPLGMIGSAAGSPLAQTKGSDVDKAAQDTAHQARQTESQQKAEKAAGIGETEQDEQASERDADGRRVWELGDDEEGNKHAAQDRADDSEPRSKDPTGQRGNQLDLSG